MSRLLLLPPSIISNSALVNKLSLEEIKAAYRDGHLRDSTSSCSDAFQIVRQLYVSALECGDIDIWKASLLQESDLDAAHVDAIVQSIQADSFAASRIHVPQLQSIGWNVSLAVASSVEEAAPQAIVSVVFRISNPDGDVSVVPIEMSLPMFRSFVSSVKEAQGVLESM